MLRPGKTSRLRVRSSVAPARRRNSDTYLRYTVGLYRQALFGALHGRQEESDADTWICHGDHDGSNGNRARPDDR